MSYSKSFPRKSSKSVYPLWEEVILTPEEEKEQELLCRKENKKIMQECLNDAKEIIELSKESSEGIDIYTIASALFEKRASHVVYWKEEKAKEKFNHIN